MTIEKDEQNRNRVYEVRMVYYDELALCHEQTIEDLRENYPKAAALVESDHITEASYTNLGGEKYEFRRVYR